MREELEGAYAPPGAEPHYSEASAAPTVLEDIKRPEAIDATLEKIRSSGAEEPFFKESPVSLEEIGEKVKGEKVEGEILPTFEMPPAPPSPSFFSPEPPPVPSDSLTPKTSNLEPAPFILHEEAPAPSLSQVGDFSLDIKPEEFGPSQPEFEVIPQANIEIGGGAAAPADGRRPDADDRKKDSEGQRVVHYGDLRTPLEPATPQTPFSTLTEPSNIGDKIEPAPASSSPSEMFNLSDLGGPAASAPPAEEPPAPPPLPQTEKPNVFARLFAWMKPKATPITPPSPVAEEVPSPPPAPPESPAITNTTPLPTGAPIPEAPPSPPPQPTLSADNTFIDISSLEGTGQGNDSLTPPAKGGSASGGKT